MTAPDPVPAAPTALDQVAEMCEDYATETTTPGWDPATLSMVSAYCRELAHQMRNADDPLSSAETAEIIASAPGQIGPGLTPVGPPVTDLAILRDQLRWRRTSEPPPDSTCVLGIGGGVALTVACVRGEWRDAADGTPLNWIEWWLPIPEPPRSGGENG